MLFSIPLLVLFSSMCLITKQIEIDENNEEMVGSINTNRVTNSEVKKLNDEVEEAKFKECRKNHSYGNGGYSVDGCLEFSADGVEGTREFFICAACKCHRNYHRQETTPITSFHHQPTPITTVYETPTGYLKINGPPPRGTTTTTTALALALPSKKRFRTKFTHEQKQKMFDYAQKLGWKVKKKDQNVVQDFCNQIGVKCQVFKVWVHNNKYTLGKKP
uniref:Zinc-finger homeodomain protein 2-like n=1 Tax=Cicer arietinum TaxID=3827 RepID=A0A3Q7YGW6_CICAR|nr:zinc-finger homeodomain protein 2-like [Cicer arietinum]